MLWFFCPCDLIYFGLLTVYQSLCKALVSFLFGSIFNWAPFFAYHTKGTVRFLISDGTNIGGLCQESLKASLVLLDFTARHVLLSLISSWLAEMPKNFAFLCLTLAESIAIVGFGNLIRTFRLLVTAEWKYIILHFPRQTSSMPCRIPAITLCIFTGLQQWAGKKRYYLKE